MDIVNNIVRVICGERSGTGILVDQTHVISVRHCIEEFFENKAEIKIIIITENKEDERIADYIETKSDSGFVYLLLDTPIHNTENLYFLEEFPVPLSKYLAFGYGSGADGCRMSSKIDPLFHLNLIHPYIFGNGSDLPVILVFCTVF